MGLRTAVGAGVGIEGSVGGTGVLDRATAIGLRRLRVTPRGAPHGKSDEERNPSRDGTPTPEEVPFLHDGSIARSEWGVHIQCGLRIGWLFVSQVSFYSRRNLKRLRLTVPAKKDPAAC
jgi:hypothetical protein